ncbi:MAG: matrixin family metalloprotease [Phycisphaerales bacterium]|nr:matrixin family metalloprotease [Phycisphaerales bacterium]
MHLHRYFKAPRLAGSIVCLFTLFTVFGCETDIVPDQAGAARLDSEFDPGNMPPVKSPVLEDAAENSIFAEAQPATLAQEGAILIEGSIESNGDVDLFALGPAKRGDRITVEVTGHDGLNTVAALFDGFGDLIDANDDRSYYGGLIDPLLARVVRQDTSSLFVGVAVSSRRHFGSTQGRYDSGTYTIKVTRQPNIAVRDARHQLVFMDFDGGSSVQIGLEPIVTMRPFSAESISGRHAGQTAYIIDLVIDHMKRDFAPYNVTLLDSRHHSQPTEQHTKLYFGNYNAQYLGLADNVDTGNAFIEQEAIIYTEDFAMFENLLPSAEEVAMAIANVGSHELGHLLGLEHSGETADVMSTAASARHILENDLGFLRSRMQSDVFPVGLQNEPTLLLRNVGANPNGSSGRSIFQDLLPKPKSNWRDRAGLPDIPIMPCGRCAHVHDED